MSNIDEIKKLKKLLDDGVITEADFNKQKKRILGLNSEKNVNIEDNTEKEESTLKSSLDNYEATLINELAKEANEEESNDEEKEAKKIYDAEKAKEKARLDAYSEKRKERNAEINQTINKGVSKGIRIFKWILAICCWILFIGCIMVAVEEQPLTYSLIGILFLLLGAMACPKITDKTQEKYTTFTRFKKLIVVILVILMFVIMTM